MNQEQAKQYQPIIAELAEKGVVQQRFICKWSDVDHIDFTSQASDYRPKPEPKLRAWKTEEIPETFLVKEINGGQIYLATVCDRYVTLSNGRHKPIPFVKGAANFTDILLLLYVRLDADGNETPCGVME